MPRQLLLAYSFPPVANAESIVTAKTVRALEGWGWKSAVCTVAPRWKCVQEDPGLRELLPPGIAIHRIAPLPLVKLPRLLRCLRLNYMALLLDSLPDNSLYWYLAARLPLRGILRHSSAQLIHSRSTPLAGHFLGWAAKRQTGLPWLVHFCDPWLDGPLYSSPHPKLTRIHARWERKIIAAADAITFTADAACNEVMRKYPEEWKRKCRVIPHGFIGHGENPGRRGELDSACLNVLYLGSFYGTRHPYVLFQAMQRLKVSGRLEDRLRVWLVGRMPHRRYAEEIERLGIQSHICLHEGVPYKAACAFGHQADVLLVINSITREPNFFLESKLIDYFGFKKPVWGIVYPNGEAAEAIRASGGYVADIGRVSHIAEVIEVITRDWREGRLQGRADFNHPRIQAYRIENTTMQLADLMHEMIERAPVTP